MGKIIRFFCIAKHYLKLVSSNGLFVCTYREEGREKRRERGVRRRYGLRSLRLTSFLNIQGCTVYTNVLYQSCICCYDLYIMAQIKQNTKTVSFVEFL